MSNNAIRHDAMVVTIAPFLPPTPTAGHAYWFHHELREGFASLDVKCKIVAQRSCESEWVNGLLSQSPKRRSQRAFIPWIQLNRDVKAISGFLSEQTSQIFLHIYEGGLRELMILIELKRVGCEFKGLFNFSLYDPWLTKSGSSGRYITSRRYFEDCVTMLAGDIVFTAETRELKDELCLNRLMQVPEYPLFSSIPPYSGVAPKKSYDFLFAPLGENEALVCLDAVERFINLTATRPKIAFHMRWGTVLSYELKKRLDALGGVLISDKLSPRDYAALHRQTHVIVLPYQTYSHYKFQTSGRLLDSMAAGCKVIVPSETVLERVVMESGSGLAFNPFSAESLSLAMAKAETMNPPEALVLNAIESARRILGLISEKLGAAPAPLKLNLSSLIAMRSGYLFLSWKAFATGFATTAGVPVALIGSLLRRARSLRT